MLREPLLLAAGIPGLREMQLIEPAGGSLKGQIVYLDFDGGEDVAYNGPVTVDSFDIPAFKAPRHLAGREEEIVFATVSQISRVFDGSGVSFTAEPPTPGTVYSTVYVGGDGSRFAAWGEFYGLAEQVDVENRDRADKAFVFSENVAEAASVERKFAESLTTIISHEVGHLLGFSHLAAAPCDNPLADVAFKVPVHEEITSAALPFLKQNILDELQDANGDVDWYWPYDSRYHFDGCEFSGAASVINEGYRDAIEEADPQDLNALNAAEEFGEALHTVQDFYAHSNWVDLSLEEPAFKSSLIDQGTGDWPAFAPYTFVASGAAMLVQGEDQTPATALGPSQLSLDRRDADGNGINDHYVVHVNGQDGAHALGVISGCFGPDDCPDNVSVSHGYLFVQNEPGLAKDEAFNNDHEKNKLFDFARSLAVQQTQHELYRLIQLVGQEYGPDAAIGLRNAWVRTDPVALWQFNTLMQLGEMPLATVNTGDTLALDLAALEGGGNEFELLGFDLVQADGSLVEVNQTPSDLRFEAIVGGTKIGRDLKLTYPSSPQAPLNDPNNLVAYVIFGGREADAGLFGETGRLYFSPSSQPSIFADRDAVTSGFQGVLRVRYKVDGILQQSLIVVGPGLSSSGERAVNSTSTVLGVMKLQQRLNYLGCTDYEDQSLVVDGIIGPRTQSAIRKFKAAATTPPGDPNAQTDDLDSQTVRRLNAAGSAIPAADRAGLGEGLRQAGDRLAALETFGPFASPLPFVGSTSSDPQAAATGAQTTLGSALDLDQTLLAGLFSPLAEYLQTTEYPDATGLDSFLAERGLAGMVPGSFEVIARGPAENRFEVQYQKSVVTPRKLDISSAADEGLALAGEVNVDLTAAITVDLEFGLDLTKQNITDSFFLKINNLTATADAGVQGALSVPLLGRFLKLSVDNSTLDLDADLNLSTTELTLGQILASPTGGLVHVQGTSSAAGSLTVSATVFGSSYSGTVSFADNNLFDGAPMTVSLGLGEFHGLEQLLRTSAANFQGAFGQMGNLIDSLRSSGLLGQTIGLVDGVTVGNVMKLKEVWDQRVTNLFQSGSSGVAVKSLQDLLTALGPALRGGRFNQQSKVLEMDLDFSQVLASQSAPIGFEASLGRLANISSTSLVSLQAEVGFEITLGIDLSRAIGEGFILNDDTDLVNLNGPDGVSPVYDDQGKLLWNKADRLGVVDGFRFTLSDGTSFDAYLDDLSKVGQVRSAINSAARTALGAFRYDQLYTNTAVEFASIDGDHLVLLDRTKGSAGAFSSSALNKSLAGMAGVGLGIYGSAEQPIQSGDFEIRGSALHNDSLAKRLFLVSVSANRPTLDGAIHVAADDIDATARLGFAEATIGNGEPDSGPAGTASAQARVSLVLDGTAASDGRITLEELVRGLNATASLSAGATLVGSATLQLPMAVTVPWLAPAPSGMVTATWKDITDPSTIDVGYGGNLGDAFRFQSLDSGKIASALSSLTSYLASLEEFSFLNDKLPIINRSLGDVIGLGARFSGLLSRFQANPAQTLTGLEAALEQALDVQVTMAADGNALKMGFDFGAAVDQETALNLDLTSLGLSALASLADVRGTAKFRLAAHANLHLDVGVDLSNTELPRPFLYAETTRASLDAKVWGTNIHFTAAIGPLGVSIGNGQASNGWLALDSDGTAEPAYNAADKSTFSAILKDHDGIPDGRVYFTTLNVQNLEPGPLAGQFHLHLPMYKADKATSIGSLDWRFALSDLAHLPPIQETPDFAALFADLSLGGSLDVMADGIDGFFTLLDAAIDNQAFLAKIPVIGDKLREAARFVGDIRDKIYDNLQTAGQKSVEFVRQKIYEAVGPGGLGWLRDYDTGSQNPALVSIQDVVVTPTNVGPNTQEVLFDMRLKQTVAVVNVPVGFDIGLPLVGLEVNGGVQLEVGFEWDLGLGINRDDGLFLLTHTLDRDAPPELKVFVEATVPGFSATGKLGFLQVDATDGTDLNRDGRIAPEEKTRLNATILVDLRDPTGDGKLTLAELGSVSDFSDVIVACFSDDENDNRADVNLHLVASFGGNADFPRMETDFNLGWAFNSSSAKADTASLGSAPSLAFNHVTIYPGQAISNFAGPVLDKVNSILAPVKPVIEILQTPLPVISQLAGRDFTLLDIAEFFGYLSPETCRFIDAAGDLVELAELAHTITTVGLDIGNFSIAGGGTGSRGMSDVGGGTDLRQAPLSSINASAIPGSTTPLSLDSLPAAKRFKEKADAIKGGDTSGARFPILEQPLSALQLLLGKEDVRLFEYDMPALSVEAQFHQSYWLITPFLSAVLAGRIGAAMDFTFGFDTKGLVEYSRTGDASKVFDGFYVSDRVGSEPTGEDVPEGVLYGAIEAGAALGGDFGVATIELGVKGGIYATIEANLNDPNQDGRVRMSEIVQNLRGGPECLFDIDGSLDAGLVGFVKIEVSLGFTSITIVDAEKPIASVTLVDFHHTGGVPADTDTLAEVDGSGKMTLHLNQSGDDNFRLRRGANDHEIIVTARGKSETFADVNTIYGAAGGGNDVIIIDPSVTLDTEIHGGAGNDKLTAGTGRATFYGEEGDDILTGGSEADTLEGGAGQDRLLGQDGNDTLRGGAGNDDLRGGLGDDVIYGDAGNDSLSGELGIDVLYGGLGLDRLDGGLDNDDLWGGDDNDSMLGGDGRDVLHGGPGDDRLEGGLGNDKLYGDSGNDHLDGGRSNDWIWGGAGNDIIIGGLGSDSLYGDEGNDYVLAGLAPAGGDTDAQHWIDGGTGDDIIYGDIGPDTIYGWSGNDQVFALAGDDRIDAGEGCDFVIAGAGSDLVIGGWGRDTIYAGINREGSPAGTGEANTIYGDLDASDRDNPAGMPRGPAANHDDLIYGDRGDDAIYAGFGNDVVYGLAGSDTIEGGWQADIIYAGTSEIGGGSATDHHLIYGDVRLDMAAPGAAEDHRDRVYGDIGNDEVYAGVSSDTVFALSGSDLIYAGAGNDSVESGPGDDTVYGEAGDDSILAGTGTDLVFGGGGKDMIRGEAGDDFLVGGTGDDEISGGIGMDVIWGGTEVIGFDSFHRDVVTDFDYPTNFPGATWPDIRGMQRIVPLALAGLSVEGQIDDGNDRLRGDEDNDWLFGGGAQDDLDGGAGGDYLDGGAGNDYLRGSDGDDLIRGGANDDVLRGGAGIDQLFGDGGVDYLFADAGADVGGVHVLEFQRLFGGDGIDYLYAYAQSTQSAGIEIEKALLGDELHGGGGGDWLYGNIRREVFYGDGANDTIQGDGIVGPNYADNGSKSVIGGIDVLYGGSGEDRLYGGGGDDVIWGGADSDWLEGQDGVDALYGGGGIDMLLLDTSTSYVAIPTGQREVFDGHFGNVLPEDTPDDNATDILLVEGTDGNDVIRLGQEAYGLPSGRTGSRLVIDFNGRLLSADWRDFHDIGDQNGKPLVEQFRVSGLGGNDDIQFVLQAAGGLDPLDLSDLVQRSEDWVGVLDGGPGNDTLRGTQARDRIDGGFGNDTIYGLGGDDQLWGDGGPGMGNPGDVDVIYGGQGHDDILGGQGRNALYAWSQDPVAGGQFGVFVDVSGGLHDNDGDMDDDGLLDADRVSPPYALEDTGLNRVLGGPQTDVLFGGTGLDFLYGNGAPESDPDRIYDRHGNLFESQDGGLAGDEWKEYARLKSTDKVWYYSGSNRDDMITVDYVTEPGLLQGHHLITRLTNNNGNFTFDAQVKLDFEARDKNGNLIWDPNDSYYGLAVTGRQPGPTDGRLSDELRFSLSLDYGEIVELCVSAAATANNQKLRDLALDIDHALAVAELGGKIGARVAGDRISLVRLSCTVSETASMVITSVNSAARDVLGFSAGADGDPAGHQAVIGFVGSNGLSSLLPSEGDFLAIIIDALDGNDQVTVGPTVIKSVWTDAGRGDDRVEYVSGKPILIDMTDSRAGNPIGNGDIDLADDLGQRLAPETGRLAGSYVVTGLTIDSPTDEDWYKFRFAVAPQLGDCIKITSISPLDRLTFELYDSLAPNTPAVRTASSGTIELNGLSAFNLDGTAKTHYLHVKSDRTPTVYEIEFIVGGAAGNNTTKAAAKPLDAADSIYAYASILGRPLNAVNDRSWFKFTLTSAARPGDQVALTVFGAEGPLTLSLIDATDKVLDAASTGGSSVSAVVRLDGLMPGTYWLLVSGRGPAQYELSPRIARLDPLDPEKLVYGTQTVDLSSQVVTYLGDPTIIVRKDVILGGEGNDVLQGGPGEDWIFGGPGNDVICGGFDRQAGDLMWGGPGDDIYQVVTDRLPATKAAQRRVGAASNVTYIPTTDRFDGQDGDDQVLYLGGDLDINGRPVPDNMAIRWNTIFHRYEITSRVWNFQGHEWAAESLDSPAVVAASGAGPETGQLSADAVFSVKVGNDSPVEVTITKEETRFNSHLEHLVEQINRALRDKNLRGKVFAGLRGDRITLSTVAVGPTALVQITAANDEAANVLGLAVMAQPATGQSDTAAFQQHYAFYTVFNTEQTVIDTRRGDDEVHADPEYLIRGSEWGIDPEDRPQRATLVNLVISGGEGNDRLFGGAGNDRIEGGAGADAIVGGGGNDQIDGGSGNDWIAGGPSRLVPDRYEFSSGQPNDTAVYAALLVEDLIPLRPSSATDQPEDVIIKDLNLHYGDLGDWYVLHTPEGLKQFGSAKASQVLKNMLSLKFTDAEAQVDTSPVRQRLGLFGYVHATGAAGRLLYLFAAQDTDPSEGMAVVPIEQFAGVPEYYLIHVVNPNAFGIVGTAEIGDTDRTLSAPATFKLAIDGGPAIPATVGAGLRNDWNALESDVQSAVNLATGLQANGDPKVKVTRVGVQDYRLGLWLVDPAAKKLTLSEVNAVAAARLHLVPAVLDLDHRDQGMPPEGIGGYELTLRAPAVASAGIGSTIEVSAGSSAEAHIEASLQDRPVMIPLGDINGDGYADFIGAVQDNGSQTLARVYFGDADLGSARLGRYDFVLQLPAPVLTPGTGGAQTNFAVGDFNGDGLSDIAVGVSGSTGPGVYMILGRHDALGLVADRVVQPDDVINATSFQLRIDDTGNWATISLPATDATHLLAALNTALTAAGLADHVAAEAPAALDGRVRLQLLQGRSLEITFADPRTNPLSTVLGFREGQRNAWSGGTSRPLVVCDSYDVKISGTGNTVAVACAGNTDGDPANPATGRTVDDLLIGDPTAGSGGQGRAYLFDGDVSWHPAGTALAADFASSRGDAFDELFNLDNSPFSGTVSALGKDGNDWIVITSPGHGLTSTEKVLVSNVTGIDPLQLWDIDVRNANQFALMDSSGDPVLAEGAAWTLDASAGLWHLSPAGRSVETRYGSLYFGQGETASGGGTYDTGQHVAGRATSPVLDLTSVSTSANVELAFRFLLNTEVPNTGFDQAQVRARKGADVFEDLAMLVAGGNITAATNANPIVITSANHGLSPGSRVTVSGVVGNTAANGTWTATRIDANRFSLDSSVGNGAYTTGGKWQLAGWQSFKLDLNTWLAGYRGAIQLQFQFDTVDSLANNYEGWYVDDVVVRARAIDLTVANAAQTYSTTVASEGLGASVAGIGNFDGTGADDFAILSSGPVAGAKVAIYSGGATPNVAATITHSTLLSGYTLAGAGQVDGDLYDDLVLSSASGDSYLIFGNTASGALDGSQGKALKLPGVGGLLPLGDIDGDGLADLGHIATVTTDRLLENTQSLKHLVGQVFLGTPFVYPAQEAQDLFRTPALEVETGRPTYAGSLGMPRYFFGSLVGQRHFGGFCCCKSWGVNSVGEGHGRQVMHDLILFTSIPKALSRAILVFVWDLRPC